MLAAERARICYDRDGCTLTVWVGDPASEDVCEEADDDTILMKDAQGRIIGVETLDVALAPGAHGLAVEMINLSSDAASSPVDNEFGSASVRDS